MRIARVIGVAVLVLLLALIPLSMLIAPGQFEIQFPTRGASFEEALTVQLDDRTGQARGLAPALPQRGVGPAVTNYGADYRVLIVKLEGSSCDWLTQLALEPAGNAFLLREKTHERSCAIGTGKTRAVAISLWGPIDAATVRFESMR
jgi:hypothetical protein